MRLENPVTDQPKLPTEQRGACVTQVLDRMPGPGKTPLEQALLQLSLGGVPERYLERDPRLALDRPVRFRPLDAPASLVGTLGNISVGGAYIRTEQVPGPGTLLAFGFYLDHHGHKRVMRSMGRIVWTERHNGFGLRFVEPPPILVQTIDELLARRQG